MRRRAKRAGEPDPSAAAPSRLLAAIERPAAQAGLVALVVLLGVLARLPHAYDEDSYFLHHADEATYFNKAYQEYLAGPGVPLAHSGSGLPLFLEQVFRLSGVEPGDPVRQLDNGPYGNATLGAARLAYLANTLLGAGAVGATYWLALGFLRPAKALLASLLVAFDPFLLALSGHLMSEQLAVLAVTVSVGCAVRARHRLPWLLPAGAALAVAAMARGNGILLITGLVGFAVLLLRREGGAGWPRWVVGAVAVFLVALLPYLLWRADHLPGPLDYGTNTRLFADGFWDFSDPYWQSYTLAGGGEKETLADYVRSHTFGQGIDRLYRSVQFQLHDLLGGGVGHRPHPEGTVLTAWTAAPLLLALVAWRSRRELWFFPAMAAATMLPFVWTYHLHDSPRYLSHLVPLAAPLAVEGVAWLARRTPWPGRVLATYAVAFLGLYAIHPIVDGLAALGQPNPSWAWTVALTLPWLALATTAAFRRAQASPG